MKTSSRFQMTLTEDGIDAITIPCSGSRNNVRTMLSALANSAWALELLDATIRHHSRSAKAKDKAKPE